MYTAPKEKRKETPVQRLILALRLIEMDGYSDHDSALDLIWQAGFDAVDPLPEWVVHSVYSAWLAWVKHQIPERGFSDRLVHFLGLPNGLILHPGILDPSRVGIELLDFILPFLEDDTAAVA